MAKHDEQPDKIIDEDLEAGLRAVFADADNHSVLASFETQGRRLPRVLLRDVPGDATPIVKPSDRTQPCGDRYQVAGELARGGVGVVLKCRDVDLGRDVAIKVLHEHHLENDALIERFVEEAQIGGQLQHPGIVPVYELGLLESGRPFFAMKLVKGRTLSALLADRSEPNHEQRRYLAIFEQICQTLAYTHARGVIHRDLKPSNIMVGAFGEVQVVDWGFAKVLGQGGVVDEVRATRTPIDQTIVSTVRSGDAGSASMTGSVMGTPAYMPPEQARGEVEHMDERSDVFALGAILCEILTGKPPYVGEGQGALLTQAAACRLKDVDRRLARCGADQGLVAIAKRCLVAAPEARMRHAGEIADAIAKYLAGVEERARSAEIAAAEARVEAIGQRRAKRLTLGLAAAVLLAIVGTGGGIFWIGAERRASRDRAAIPVRDRLEHAQVLRGEAIAAPIDDASRWSAVLEVAETALRLAREGGVAAVEIDRAQRFLDLVRSEKVAAEETASDAQQARAIAIRLREIRTRRGADFDPAQRNDAFLSALRDHGIDMDAPGATARMQASPIRSEILGALDDWPHALASGVDPEPFRVRVRALARPNDGPELRALATARPTRPPASRALLADGLGRCGSQSIAIDIYRSLQRDRPRDFWFNFKLAWWLTRKASPEWAEAARFYAVALALEPDAIGVRYHLGIALEKRGDIDGAISVWRVVYGQDPDCGKIRTLLAQALAKRAKLYTASGVKDLALTALQNAVSIAPADWQARSQLADVLLAGLELDSAASHYLEALRLGPDDATRRSVLAQLGRLYRLQGDHESAIAREREFLDSSPRQLRAASARCRIGWSLQQLGRGEEAIAELRLSVDQASGSNFHTYLARLLAENGSTEEAEAMCRELVRKWTFRKPAAVLELAAVLDIAGRTSEAAEVISKFRKQILERRGTQNSNAFDITHLCWLIESRPDDLMQNDAAAVAATVKGLNSIPLGAAIARYRAGDYAGAQTAVLKSLELTARLPGAHHFPSQTVVRLYLAMVNWRLGHREKAHAAYQEALARAKAIDWATSLYTSEKALERLRSEAASLLGVE